MLGFCVSKFIRWTPFVGNPITKWFPSAPTKIPSLFQFHMTIKLKYRVINVCNTNVHLLKRLVHVKFPTFSYDKRIHLCFYSISLKYRNLNNRVYNLCHEVHSKNRSTAKSEVLLHHMASHNNENWLFIYLLGTLPLPLFTVPTALRL